MADATTTRDKAPLWQVAAVLALPSLCWAGNFIVARAMRADIPPITLSFARTVIALAVLTPFAWRHIRDQWGWYRAHWLRVFLIGLCGVTSFNTIVYEGLRYTSATNGLLLNSTIPVWVLILGALFWGRPIRGAQILGLAVSMLGVATVILHGELSRLIGLEVSRGDAIILVAMFGWALYTLGLASIPAEINRLGLLCAHLALALVTLLPLLIWSLQTGPTPVWGGATFAAMFYIGLIPSLLALILFMRAVSIAGPALAGQSVHLMPVYGAALGTLFLGEQLHAYHAIGFALILVGIVLTSLVGRRRAA